MAQRRMFSKAIIDCPPFSDCTTAAKFLYFAIAMHADDDGIYETSKSFYRSIDIDSDTINELIEAGLLIDLRDNVVAVRDWRIHNYLQKDRYTPSLYVNKKEHLIINRENRYEYAEKPNNLQYTDGLYTECNQDVYNMEAQVRLGKERLETDKVKDRKDIGKRQEIKGEVFEEGEKEPTRSINELFTRYCNILGILDPIEQKCELQAINEKTHGDTLKAINMLQAAISNKMKV